MLRRSAPYFAGFLSGLLATLAILILGSPPRGHPIELRPPPTLAPMQIHVAGAVTNPGVYNLPFDAIVEQAIEAAGGPSETAALDQLNLAKKLADGEQVFVPDETSRTELAGSSTSNSASSTGVELLSLNEATEPELERLPGIGPSLAQAITRYRLEHGPFQNVEDLTNVPGIGPAKLAAIRDLVQVP